MLQIIFNRDYMLDHNIISVTILTHFLGIILIIDVAASALQKLITFGLLILFAHACCRWHRGFDGVTYWCKRNNPVRTYVTGGIGGSMGLLIGASVITLFEAIDAFATTFARRRRNEERTRRRSFNTISTHV